MKNIMADGIQSGVKRWMSGTTKKTLDYATGQGKVGRPKQFYRIPAAVVPVEWHASIEEMEKGIRPNLSSVGFAGSENSEKVMAFPGATPQPVISQPVNAPTFYSNSAPSELGMFQPLANGLQQLFNQLMPIVPYFLLLWLAYEMIKSFRS